MALLRHTTTEVKPRSALTVNAAKTCQPVGAMYAALGVHRCLPHSHGSQGCCAYHRSALTRHYKEPIMAATSSFTEGSSVFGGQSNLLQAVQTIFTTYDPDIIAVHTTCLSETIGDDIPQILSKAREKGHVPEGKVVVHANTPSYVGAHVTGFANMVEGFIHYLAQAEPKSPETLNLLPGWVEPSDMRELKRIVELMGREAILLPDTSDVLDAPLDGQRAFYPEGGTRIEAIRRMGGSGRTLALGPVCSKAPAVKLTDKCGVPHELLDLPIGLKATDRFVNALRSFGSGSVPKALANERGRLVDVISDMHQYLYRKRVALVGDPDQLVALAEFTADLDMEPVYIVTGTPGKAFLGRIEEKLAGRVPDAKVAQGQQADMFLLHQWIKQEPVDLIIGNSYCKYISRDEDIPFIRHGFPVMDRVGHSYFPTVGYTGALRLLEKMLDAILSRKDRDAPEESFELVM